MKLPMEVKFRKVRDISENLHGEVFIEMLVYIIQYAVKAPRIDVLFGSKVMFH